MVDDVRFRRVGAAKEQFVRHQPLVAAKNGLAGKEKIVGRLYDVDDCVTEHVNIRKLMQRRGWRFLMQYI